MSNKNLLQPNFTFNRAITYVITVTENILTASIAEQLRVCLVCGSSGVQNPRHLSQLELNN